jgi:hypothetical protein
VLRIQTRSLHVANKFGKSVMPLSPQYVPWDGSGTPAFHGQSVADMKDQIGLCISVKFFLC